MFVGMAQMFLPDLAELSLLPGEPPVQIPASMLPAPGLVAYAALSDEAIGLSVGEGKETGLPAYLDQKPGSDGTFLSTSYDLSAYMEMTQDLGEQMEAMTAQSDPEFEAQLSPFKSIGEAARDAFRNMADRSNLTMQLTEEGFVTDSRMTFK